MVRLEKGILKQRGFIVGRSGYGKTNVAKGSVAEPLLRARERVGIFDPTDSWHGLRLMPDGETPAYKVVIFGGEFGDLPLHPDAGAVMGRALAEAPDSWIISFADMPSERAREKFAAEFLEALYHHNRAPITLIVDEADTFAPQKPADPIQNTLTARMTQIVKRGRKRGFTPWLITQRPADIAKAVTSQADVVIAMSLTLPHDKKAVMDYVKDHDEDGTATAMFKAMPQLPRGEGIVWWPGGKVLERRQFELSKTFDSGKTPEPGDKAIKLRPLKVDALAKAMEQFIQEKEANDPKRLQERISQLEAENAALLAADGPGADVYSEADLAAARQDGLATGMVDGRNAEREDWLGELHKVGAVVIESAATLKERLAALPAAFAEVDQAIDGLGALAERWRQRFLDAPPVPLNGRDSLMPTPMIGQIRSNSVKIGQIRPVPTATAEGLTNPQQRMLDALAWLEWCGIKEADKPRLAMLSDQSPSSSGFRANLSALSAKGLVDRDGITLTPAGRAIANKPVGRPTNQVLHDAIIAKITGPQGKMLQALIGVYPKVVHKINLAGATDQSPTSSGFRANLSTLSALGFLKRVDADTVQAAAVLFVEKGSHP